MNAEQLFEDFLNNKTPEATAGKGRKQCPECSRYVGVRSFKCECGYQFVNKKTKLEERDQYDVPSEEEILYAKCIGSSGGRLVYAGCGSTSVILTDITEEVVSDYCNLVVHEGNQKGVIYTLLAIKHFIQHQFGYNSEEYRQAVKFVDKWYDDKIGVDTTSGAEYNEEV